MTAGSGCADRAVLGSDRVWSGRKWARLLRCDHKRPHANSSQPAHTQPSRV